MVAPAVLKLHETCTREDSDETVSAFRIDGADHLRCPAKMVAIGTVPSTLKPFSFLWVVCRMWMDLVRWQPQREILKQHKRSRGRHFVHLI